MPEANQMRISPNHLLVLALLLALSAGSVAACRGSVSSPDDDKLNVVVSIVPQKYFVERIGGEHVSVSVMVEPGANPATYEPKPGQLKALSSAAAYFSIGVPFEDAWLGKIAAANDEMVMVDTIASIERMPMDAHHHEEDARSGAHVGEHGDKKPIAPPGQPAPDPRRDNEDAEGGDKPHKDKPGGDCLKISAADGGAENNKGDERRK